MSVRKFPVFLAMATVLIASLACISLSTTPTVSNFYMASDEGGQNKTTVFAPDQDFYVFFKVENVEAGTNFQSRWYALDVEGQSPNEPFKTIDYSYESGVSTIYFQLTNSGGWPTGHYKVEIYMGGNKAGEQQFSVQ